MGILWAHTGAIGCIVLNIHSPIPTSFLHVNCSISDECKTNSSTKVNILMTVCPSSWNVAIESLHLKRLTGVYLLPTQMYNLLDKPLSWNYMQVVKNVLLQVTHKSVQEYVSMRASISADQHSDILSNSAIQL